MTVEPPLEDYETNTLRFKSIDQWCLNIMMSIPNESEIVHLTWLIWQQLQHLNKAAEDTMDGTNKSSDTDLV